MIYNIILVYNHTGEKLLFCERTLEPFKGQLNLVGGKVESDDYLDEAYRELKEETGIKSEEIFLRHFMDFNYAYYDIVLQVYVGQLNRPVKLVEEVNKLLWLDEGENFFSSRFAGDGNIGHIVKQVHYEKDKILKKP